MDRRTKRDFAKALQKLADVHFPDRKIVLIMYILNAHRLYNLLRNL